MKDELAISNLNFTLLQSRLLTKSYAFFAAVVVLQLFAVFPRYAATETSGALSAVPPMLVWSYMSPQEGIRIDPSLQAAIGAVNRTWSCADAQESLWGWGATQSPTLGM